MSKRKLFQSPEYDSDSGDDYVSFLGEKSYESSSYPKTRTSPKRRTSSPERRVRQRFLSDEDDETSGYISDNFYYRFNDRGEKEFIYDDGYTDSKVSERIVRKIVGNINSVPNYDQYSLKFNVSPPYYNPVSSSSSTIYISPRSNKSSPRSSPGMDVVPPYDRSSDNMSINSPRSSPRGSSPQMPPGTYSPAISPRSSPRYSPRYSPKFSSPQMPRSSPRY